MTRFLCALLLPTLSMHVAAQWINYPTPGIPRTEDGKPNLTAPAPRTADGKPDLSGLWGMVPNSYTGNIVADLKPEEVRPWADALYKQRREAFGRDDPSRIRCLPFGPKANLYSPMLEKIVQTPDLIIILMEDLTFRQVFLDGRNLEQDPNPSFMGYAIGHWDGDTLVVASNGYNETTWLDVYGHPHSESLRITERFHRRDFGHLDIDETLEDPKIYARAWTIRLQANLAADTDMIEYVCAENERDREHQVGKVSDLEGTQDSGKGAVKVPPEVLSGYVGTYECFTCIPENPVAIVTTNITVSGGELFSNGTRLVPLSDSVFSRGGSRVEFVTNDKGLVTHFTTRSPEGEHKAIRKPDAK